MKLCVIKGDNTNCIAVFNTLVPVCSVVRRQTNLKSLSRLWITNMLQNLTNRAINSVHFSGDSYGISLPQERPYFRTTLQASTQTIKHPESETTFALYNAAECRFSFSK
jgi:hypothetical protein